MISSLIQLLHTTGLGLALSAVFLAAPAMGEILPENDNPSFEVDRPLSKGAPTGWNWEGPADLLCVVADSPLFEPGRQSVQIDYRGRDIASNVFFGWSGMIAIDPARPAVVSGWLKTEGAHQGFGGTIAWRFYDKDKNQIMPAGSERQNYLVKNTGPQAWTYHSQELVPDASPEDAAWEENEIPAQARYVSIGFCAMYYPGRVWFDGLRWETLRGSADQPSLGHYRLAHAATHISSIVTVDGRLDEPVWKSSAQWQEDFSTTVCVPEKVVPAQSDTRFKIAMDDQHVYIAFICKTSDENAVVAQPRARNESGIFGDDTIEFYLDASAGKGVVYHASINPAGALHEEWNGSPTTLATAVAAERVKDRWIVELAIPRTRLWQLYDEGGASVYEPMWLINVARHQPAGGADRFTAWSYTGSSGFKNDASLSPLLFQDEKSVLIDQLGEMQQRMNEALPAVLPDENDADMPPQAVSLLAQIQQRKANHARLLEHITSAEKISSADFLRAMDQASQSFASLPSLGMQLQTLLTDLPANRAEYGYVLFQAPLLQRPRAEQLPSADRMIDRLAIRMAGNEIATGTFSIFTKESLSDIAIDWSELASADGAVLPRSAVDVRIAHTWGSRRQADILATDLRIPLKGWLSDYHLAQRFIPQIAANTSQKCYVTIHADGDVKPSIYTGEITIAPSNRPPTKLSLTVEILPFDLPETARYVGFYYHGVLQREGQPGVDGPNGMFYDGLTTDASYMAELRALRAAGFNTLILPDYSTGPLNADYTRRLLAPAVQLGFKRVILLGSEHVITYGLAQTPEEESRLSTNRQRLNDLLGNVYRVARELGMEDLYIYGFDEPHDENGIMRNRIIAEAAHAHGGKVATAVIFRDVFNSIRDVIDLPIVSWAGMTSELKPGETPLEYAGSTESGPRPMMYYANLVADVTPTVRTAFGWYLYKSQLAGNVPWALYYLGPGWNPFTEEYPIDTALYIFPTKDQPIPTLKYVAAVEGVTDLRYLELLNQHIERAQNRERAAAAERRLDEMLNTLEYANTRGERSGNYLIPPEQLEQYRTELQDLILSLD